MAYCLHYTSKGSVAPLLMQTHYFAVCLGLSCMFFVILDVFKLSCLICSRGNQAYTKGRLTEAEECYTHGIDSFSPNEDSRKH